MDKDDSEPIYGIWFTRPKEVNYFGLIPVLKKKFTSEIHDQDEEDCLQIIELFRNNRFDELESKYKK